MPSPLLTHHPLPLSWGSGRHSRVGRGAGGRGSTLQVQMVTQEGSPPHGFHGQAASSHKGSGSLSHCDKRIQVPKRVLPCKSWLCSGKGYLVRARRTQLEGLTLQSSPAGKGSWQRGPCVWWPWQPHQHAETENPGGFKGTAGWLGHHDYITIPLWGHT